MNCLKFKSIFAPILSILMLFETLPGVFAYEADAQTGCVVDQSFSSDSDLDDFTVEIPDGKTYSYSPTGGLSFKNLKYAHVIYDNPVSGNYMFKVRARSADSKDIDIYLNYSDDAYYLLEITGGSDGKASISKYSGSSETVLATSSGFAKGGYFTIYCYEDADGVYHIDANMTYDSKTASISAVDDTEIITQGKIWVNVPNTITAVNEWKINQLQKIVSADIQTDNFPIGESMTLTFSYPLSKAGVLENIAILHDDAEVDCNYNLSDDSKTLTITPKSDLAYSSEYILQISKDISIIDTEYKMMYDMEYVFRTEPDLLAQERLDAITAINNYKAIAADEQRNETEVLSELLKDNADILKFNSDFINTVDVSEIAEYIIENELTFDTEDEGSYLKQLVNNRMVIAAFNQSKRNLIMNEKNTDFVYATVDFDTLTMYELYESSITEKGREKIISSLFGKNFDNAEQIISQFSIQTYLCAITDNVAANTSTVKSILVKYADEYGVNLDKYNGLTDTSYVDEKLVSSGEIKSLEELSEKIALYIAEYYEENEYTDLSVYTYTFSAKDAEFTEWENYGFEIFNDERGAYNSVGTGLNSLISPVEFRGDYNIEVSLYKNYNISRVIFNRVDENNYYYIENNGATEFNFGKVIDGVKEVVATAASTFGCQYVVTTFNISYNSDGYISCEISNESGTVNRLFKDIEDTSLNHGKIGIEFQNAQGYVKDVTVSAYLSVIGGSIMKDQRIAINSDVTIEFNYPVNVNTAKGNITVEDMTENDYSLTFSDDQKTATIKFAKPLDYERTYCVNIEKNLFFKLKNQGLITDKKFTFMSERPNVYFDDNGISDGFKSVYDAKGSTVTVYAKASNTSSQNVPYTLTMVLEDNGKQLCVVPTIGTLSANTVDEVVCFEDINIPETVSQNAQIKYYMLKSFESMQTLYPYKAVTAVSESPVYGMVYNNQGVIVSGTTASGMGNRLITVLVVNSPYNINALDSQGAIAYQSEVYTDSDGKYSIYVEPLASDSGLYKLYVGGDDYTHASEGVDIAIADLNAKNNAVAQVNLNPTLDVISNYADVLGINNTVFKSIDKSSLISQVKKITDDGGFDETDGGQELQKFIHEQTVLLALSQNKKEELQTADGQALFDSVVDFEIVDEKFSSNAFEVYKGGLTDYGVKLVDDSLFGGELSTMDALYKKFIQSVVLYSMKNYENNGYGHIYDILIKNASICSLDISKYYSLADTGEIDRKIFNADITKLDDINTILTENKDNYNSGSSSGVGSSGAGSSGGSSYSTPQYLENEQNAKFNDLSGYEWAEPAIYYLAQKNIISGVGNGNFEPNRQVNREEFVKMVMLAFDYEVSDDSNSVFVDVESGSWYEKFVVSAYKQKVITGMSDTEFGIGVELSRQDAAVMLYRVLAPDKKAGADLKTVFKDSGMISDYSIEAVTYMYENGIMKGIGDDLFAPNEICTRAQAAKIIYEIIK